MHIIVRQSSVCKLISQNHQTCPPNQKKSNQSKASIEFDRHIQIVESVN